MKMMKVITKKMKIMMKKMMKTKMIEYNFLLNKCLYFTFNMLNVVIKEWGTIQYNTKTLRWR